MKPLVALVLCAGCFAASSSSSKGSGGARPGVMPMLSELPGDPGKRDAILDQSGQTPGPELRKGQTAKEKRAETAAAGVAAIIGSMFSTTQNVTLGTATTFDENEMLSPTAPARPRTPDGQTAPSPDPVDAKTLVPWVKVAPATDPAK